MRAAALIRTIQRRRKSRFLLRRSRYAYRRARSTVSFAVLYNLLRAPRAPLAACMIFFLRLRRATDVRTLGIVSLLAVEQAFDALLVGGRDQGASPEGLLDLSGNVWKWCQDHYNPRAYELPKGEDPVLTVTGPKAKAVKRGGSWTNSAESLRCSKRGFEKLHVRRNNLGFRCASDLEG